MSNVKDFIRELFKSKADVYGPDYVACGIDWSDILAFVMASLLCVFFIPRYFPWLKIWHILIVLGVVFFIMVVTGEFVAYKKRDDK